MIDEREMLVHIRSCPRGIVVGDATDDQLREVIEIGGPLAPWVWAASRELDRRGDKGALAEAERRASEVRPLMGAESLAALTSLATGHRHTAIGRVAAGALS